MSKRIKITRPQGTPIVIDYVAKRKEKEEEIAKDLERYYKEVVEEKKRIIDLNCPLHNTIHPDVETKKEKVSIYSVNNGGLTIMGGKNSVQNYAEYYVCQHCGLMFVDLQEKKILPPLSNKDFLF